MKRRGIAVRSSLCLGLSLMFGLALSSQSFATGRFYNPTWDTVLDREAQLLWQARGDATGRNHEEANNYCAQLTLAGKNNWRLPHIKELASLVDESSYNPSIYPYFMAQSAVYWATTPLALEGNQRFYWTLNFGDGHMHPYKPDIKYQVRCVHVG